MGTVSREVRSPSDLGLLLQSARFEKGLTQREVAEKLKTTQSYIWDMERGKKALFVTRLFRMMRLLGVTMTISFEVADRAES